MVQSLDNVLASVRSGNIKTRGTGLDDLIFLLDKNRVDLSSLRDNPYHQIFEEIFKCVIIERQTFFSAKKNTTATTRLEKCAKALRLSVQHGASRIKRKVVLSVIGHVTDAIFAHDGTLVEPLQKDYFQVLIALLSHQANAEHLATYGAAAWLSCLDFCLEILEPALERSTQQDFSSFSGSRSSPAPGTLSLSSTGLRSSGRTANKLPHQPALSQDLLNSLLRIIHLLLTPPNAAIKAKARTARIFDVLLQVLQLRMSLGSPIKYAFACLNILFVNVQADDVQLSKRIARDAIPVLRNWWQGRTVSHDQLQHSVRDEMLIFIFSIRLHLERVALDDPTILDDIEQFADILWAEYTQRSSRDKLQLADITFNTSILPPGWLTVRSFGLRPHYPEGERKWALLQNLAFLEYILRQKHEHKDRNLPNEEVDEDHPRKRRRKVQHSSRIHEKLKRGGNSAEAALQLIPFLLNLDFDPIEIQADVAACVSSDKPWTLLAYASCVLHCGLDNHAWETPWKNAVRAISLQSTSRVGSFLMKTMLDSGCIPYHSIAEDINSIITNAHVNGPAVLADSSIQLMGLLQILRNAKLPSASQQTSQHIIRWASLKWMPATASYSSADSLHVHPVEYANLLLTCCGADLLPLDQAPLPGTSISQVWRDDRDYAAAVRYVLLLPESGSPSVAQGAASPNTKSVRLADAATYHNSKLLVLESLFPRYEELKDQCHSWSLKPSDGGSQMTATTLQSLLAACTIGAILAPQVTDLNTRQSRDIEPVVFELLDMALASISRSPDGKYFFGLLLQETGYHVPPLITARLQLLVKEHSCLLRLYSTIAEFLRGQAEKESSAQNSSGDFMELDDDFESQESRTSSASRARVFEVPRHNTSLRMSREAFHQATKFRIQLLGAYHGDHGSQTGLVPPELVNSIAEMTSETFLLSGDALSELFNSDLLVNADEARQVVEKLGEIIGEPEYTSCEAAQSLGLSLISGLSQIWLDERNTEISESVKDIYDYFVKDSLPHNSLSPRSQIAFSELLLCLLRNDPDYGTKLDLPSCRTTLLSILQDGVMFVKYYIAFCLPDIFGLYILKTHDEVFVDVLEVLPVDENVVEGIAFRIFVLAELACRWPTLLRRCTYHIFEAPGGVPACTEYATHCVAKISAALKLKSPQDLFDLFCPQLLYTWLENEPLQSMPFQIFGFTSLRAMLQACHAETAALMLMRGQEEAAKSLAQELSTSCPDLVKSGFPKIMAYAIAQDVSTSSAGPDSAENRIRKILGREPFLDAVYANFADIVAILLDVFDQESPFEKYLAKDANFAYAATTMNEIKALSHSEVGLPANQQPMFKAKYLLRELFQLCSKTEYELATLWTPSLVIAVARRLFNTMHPALGSLHACSALRKIRVLICLAGPAVFEQYPLEMLLQSIRPLMVDSECADDALGITQYLISKGTGYLTQAPSFLAGYGLSTLASLRVFLESSQSSTTQESQFKATMSKAQKFHGWLAKYLGDYDSRYFADENQRDSFKTIIQAASNIRSSGNAEKDTNESTLLLEILRDEKSEQQLLNEPARELALGLLCGDFVVPISARQDVITSDSLAIEHSSIVWQSCRANDLSNEYLAWAGRVMGRSFAASGEVQPELLRESELARHLELASGANNSAEGLIALIQRLTSSKDSFTAGLAESALRAIISEAIAQGDEALAGAAQQTMTEALYTASDWQPYRTPTSDISLADKPREAELFNHASIKQALWIRHLGAYLVRATSTDILLNHLGQLVLHATGFTEDALPFIVHLALSNQIDKQQTIKRQLSESFRYWLDLKDDTAMMHQRQILNVLLYLRTQKYPDETSIADRSQWLDVDFGITASAATRCGMHKTALLFTEAAASQITRASRRSSAAREEESTDVLLKIYENINDPDTYYGLSQPPSLSNVLARVEYEKDGSTSLAFRAAQYQTHLRQGNSASHADGLALVSSLSTLGLSGLAHSLLRTLDNVEDNDTRTSRGTFDLARRLEIWNLPAPASSDNCTATLYKAFQGIQQATEPEAFRLAIYDGYQHMMRSLTRGTLNAAGLRSHLGALAALVELDDVLNASDFADLEGILARFEVHTQWMRRGNFDTVSTLLSCRETTLNLLSCQASLRSVSRVSTAQARQVQIRGMLDSSSIYRYHRATQESLNLATTLTGLVTKCEELGMNVDAVVQMETANSLWDSGEMITSIRMLQTIDDSAVLKKQDIPVARSDLLSKLGHQISVARLEKPHDIQKRYLEPALKELKGRSEGKEAGRVLHQFAMFCDSQLQNPDGLEDLARLQNLKKGKSDEVKQLKTLLSTARDSQTKQRYSSHLAKAQQWLNLDEQELRRVEQTRGEFVRLSLENYLLSLIASDEYNNDALRFTAIWLERSDEQLTNDAVRKYLDKVPTRKFAALMNQLSSRLQDQKTSFQELLMGLVRNICVDHPYHGMYHIWSGTKTRANEKDEIAVRRQRATDRVSKHLEKHALVGTIWHAIDRTSGYYHRLAADRDPSKYKAGHKINLKDTTTGNYLVNALNKYRIPPPTLQMELAADGNYSNVPTMARLEPQMTIASGVSAPKIITAIGSDGQRYRQLVKGGNDDLRQDAIMEQVFAAVSSLLKLHRETQQRSLGIRTYKVLPLTSVSGVIEFVPNTIPLHEFLMPAHERYYPKDLKGGQCRKEISNAQSKSTEARISTYRKVKEKFHPVMKYFFLEYFVDPDEWFVKRTAYTRTTAAISMLGHVLGLGDRHGHNILLDHKTGEVVHIDLGVAFEMGRVLPVPELVPFRLTRDIEDGMGITKTEGVFRRCCEFTLDALREETYSIMTILDVLRYDPLYSWSISPVRLAKLQTTAVEDDADAEAALGTKAQVNEPSEADRALEVVRKKLSKTLSVEATVNDLINQATDERNLAVLYSGWAAYA